MKTFKEFLQQRDEGLLNTLGYNWDYLRADKSQRQMANTLDKYTTAVNTHQPPLQKAVGDLSGIPGEDRAKRTIGNIRQDLADMSRAAHTQVL